MIVNPELVFERALWKSGLRFVAGLDEAGRGALAGPVAVGAVLFPMHVRGLLRKLDGLRDSKLMTPGARFQMRPLIQACALKTGVGFASAGEIDALGIVAATRLAASRALEQMAFLPEFLLTDFRLELPELDIPQAAIVKGDQKCLSIAAASVLAKTSRDALLCELESQYPGYGFETHKGYGTEMHRAAIRQIGYCPEHRRSFHSKELMAKN
jgi:ribonuclease HII